MIICSGSNQQISQIGGFTKCNDQSPVMDLPGLTRVGEYVPISSDNLAQIIESGMKGRD